MLVASWDKSWARPWAEYYNRSQTKKKVENRIIALLNGYIDVSSWSYSKMLGLNTNIVVHHLHLQPECKPVK